MRRTPPPHDSHDWVAMVSTARKRQLVKTRSRRQEWRRSTCLSSDADRRFPGSSRQVRQRVPQVMLATWNVAHDGSTVIVKCSRVTLRDDRHLEICPAEGPHKSQEKSRMVCCREDRVCDGDEALTDLDMAKFGTLVVVPECKWQLSLLELTGRFLEHLGIWFLVQVCLPGTCISGRNSAMT